MTTASQLPDALKVATPGAIIACEGLFSGPMLRLNGDKLSANITLDLTAATITAPWYFEKLKGWTFKRGTFQAPFSLIDCAATVSGAAFIGSDARDLNGLKVQRGKVRVLDCNFRSLRTGVSMSDVDGYELGRLAFDDMAADGITAGNCRNGHIHDIVAHDNSILDGAHADVVQLFSGIGLPATADTIIEYVTGWGMTQGIGLHNIAGDVGFDRITIRHIRMTVGYAAAVQCANIRSLSIGDIHVETFPGAVAKQALVNVDARCTGIVQTGPIDRVDPKTGLTIPYTF